MRNSKNLLLVLLLTLSLCLDISMTAYADEALPGSQPDENNPADIIPADKLPVDEPYEDAAPKDNVPAKDSPADELPAQDTNDQPSNEPEYNSPPAAEEDTSPTEENASPTEENASPTEENASPTEMSEKALPQKADEPISEEEDAAQGTTTSITISAAGDCTLGVDSRYSHNFNKYYKKKGSSYFFKKVRSVFSQDDITIVNFEGTLTTAKKRAKKPFTFKGPKKYASILKKGSVEVVNLANNHSKDYGKTSLADTQKTMKKNNIGYCIHSAISYQTVNGVKTAFLGFNALERITRKQIKQSISQAQKNNAAIIIVSFHWGVERKYYPNAKQKSLGHYAIDCGASLVLGHHPHVLQGIEQYKGRYIVYSLGNFCFGGNSNPSDKDTMIFQQTFSVKDGELQPENHAKIIPCSLSSHKKTNDFQPRPLSGNEKKKLIKKMNKLSKKFNVSIASNGKIWYAKHVTG